MTPFTLLERLNEACDPKGYANMSKALVADLRAAVVERDSFRAMLVEVRMAGFFEEEIGRLLYLEDDE